MRRFLVVAALLLLVVPASVHAGSRAESFIRFSHPVLSPGAPETVTVIARDLSGRPLRRARVVLTEHLATRTAHIHMKATNSHGVTSVVLHPSAALHGTRVSVEATISTRALSVPVSASFLITGAPAALPGSATPTATASAARTPTRTATPVKASGTGTSFAVTAQATPATATAPTPIWVVVHVHTSAGQALANVPVRATAVFSEGVIAASGTTDSAGTTTLRVDTGIARADESVHVTASATWQGNTAFGTTDAALSVPPTPIPTPTATFLPTPVPSDTPVAAPTYVPVATNTPVPTDTPLPTSTAVPTATSVPTAVPTPTVPTSCSGDSCMNALLTVLNNTRAQYGVGPLSLDLTQSNGTATCVGSIGHSEAMEKSGSIWHVNSAYPSASFPYNNCYYGGLNSPPVAQNVGMASDSNELNAILYIHNLMMSEQHFPGCTGNHACNILSPTYSRVGLGILYVNGAVWLTEDFIG